MAEDMQRRIAVEDGRAGWEKGTIEGGRNSACGVVVTLPSRERALFLLAAALTVLLGMWALLVMGARLTSVTTDEMNHLLRGYARLRMGAHQADYRWLLSSTGHPPLFNVLEALVPAEGSASLALPSFESHGYNLVTIVRDFAWRFFGYEPTPYNGWFRFRNPGWTVQDIFPARVPVMLAAILLAALLFRWAKEVDGWDAAFFTLALLAFDPNLLAHGRLATTDAGVVVVGTGALYAAWRWLREPESWRWTVGTGLLVGLTAVAKASGVIWGMAVALAFALLILHPPEGYRRGALAVRAGVAAVTAFLVLWATYGFEVGEVAGLPFPVPAATHWNLLLFPLSTKERISFALNYTYYGHQWWYFPLAFLVKNPLPTLLAASAGLVVLLRRAPRWWQERSICVIFPLLYAVVAMGWGMNIGYRHILAAQSCLALLGGLGLAALWRKGGLRRWAVLGMLLWLVGGTLSVFPNEMGYFNELVRGTEGGYRVLADSNVEWGNEFRVAEAYVETHPQAKLDGVEHPFYPEAGEIVVDKGMMGIFREVYDWFFHHEATAELGDAYLIYDIPPSSVEWVAECSVPAPPLKVEVLEAGAALPPDYRRVDFDCTQSWLYPQGGEEGLYVLHHDLVPAPRPCWPFPPQRCERLPDDPFIARHVAVQHLAYEESRPREEYPTFLLYESQGTATPPLAAIAVGQAEAAPSTLDVGAEGAQAAVGEALTFLGALAYEDASGLEVESWWRVEEAPLHRSFSLMGHLLRADGTVLGVADGLGVDPTALQTGDLLVQRHHFEGVAWEEGLWLRTGAYWLDTMERWPVEDGPADAIFVPLALLR